MTYTVEHRPLSRTRSDGFYPDWAVDAEMPEGHEVTIRCYHESTARRVAKALDLLDDWANYRDVTRDALLGESEILTRAREAAISANGFTRDVEDIRAGECDDWVSVRSAIHALRDLSKPLAELVPVDPDLIEARKIAMEGETEMMRRKIEAGEMDDSMPVHRALKGIKRGRELALSAWQASAPGNEASRRGLSGTSVGITNAQRQQAASDGVSPHQC